MRASPTVLVLVAVALASSGCADASEAPNLNSDFEDDESLWVTGIVIDAELLPVADAFASLDDGAFTAYTAVDGVFRLGPVTSGEYSLVIDKAGYSSVSQTIQVLSESPPRIVIQLEAVAVDVPYFETQQYASIIGCAIATPTSRITCGLLAQVTGVSPVPDTSVFAFTIPNQGLATLLVETTWESGTAFARELSVNVLDQEGDQSNCLTTACYAEAAGSSPVRIRFVPGEALTFNGIEYQPFPGEQGHGFNAYLMPPFGTAANPASVYADQRADSYLTFFYNRAGSEEFTALPDA